MPMSELRVGGRQRNLATCYWDRGRWKSKNIKDVSNTWISRRSFWWGRYKSVGTKYGQVWLATDGDSIPIFIGWL